jgi:hypothetical protein
MTLKEKDEAFFASVFLFLSPEETCNLHHRRYLVVPLSERESEGT